MCDLSVNPPLPHIHTCLMENSTHTSCLSLGAYHITACGLTVCWTHPMESLSLVPRESVPQEAILYEM